MDVYLWQTNLKAKVYKTSTFQVNRKKNGTGTKNDTGNPFGYKLGESTENNEALLFFSGKKTIQNFNGSI